MRTEQVSQVSAWREVALTGLRPLVSTARAGHAGRHAVSRVWRGGGAHAASTASSGISSYFLRSESLMPNSVSRRCRSCNHSMSGRGRIWSSTTSRCGRIFPPVKSTVSVPVGRVCRPE
eukprot:scaffold15276_cov49-Phaeocystis_antarctica.AAC.1